MTQSLQYVFQSFEDNWSLSLDLTPAKAAKRIQAVVDLLAMTTVIDRQGRSRYEVRVALQNRSEQFLHINVPEGLHLWSAKVAGQPVKPVRAADSPKEEILIPLVKTSPGGLPYDVFLYLAGQGVTSLNGTSRLKPPGVSIVGIPVMQTTWSLRLPGGYRYLRPKGNMAPIAGTAEALSIGVEARLKQLKRLGKTYRDSSISVGRETVVRKNVKSFSDKLSYEINQAESFLESNRDELGGQEYHRLKSQLGQQKVSQSAFIEGHEKYVQKQVEQTRKDLNVFLNASSSNTGMSEVLRNEFLLEKPAFVGVNERLQIDRLEKQLHISKQQQKNAPAIKGRTRIAGESILSQQDKEQQVSTILEKLKDEDAAQITHQQELMKKQLAELKDNRMQRQFSADRKISKTAASQRKQTRGMGPGMAGPGGMMGPGMGPGRARRDRSSKRDAQSQPFQVKTPSAPSESTEAEASAIATAQTQRPYAAQGIYSLPVSLPAGEVRLDFARPAGGAQLSILAIPVNSIHNLYGSITVIGAMLLVMGLIKIWPKHDKKLQLPTKRMIAYLALLLLLSFILGLLGLFISFLIILMCETRRSASAKRLLSKAKN